MNDTNGTETVSTEDMVKALARFKAMPERSADRTTRRVRLVQMRRDLEEQLRRRGVDPDTVRPDQGELRRQQGHPGDEW